MRLIGRHLLICNEASLRGWINHWSAEVRHASWRSKGDIANQFPNVLHVAPTRFSFKVSESNFFIDTDIDLERGITCISGLREI